MALVLAIRPVQAMGVEVRGEKEPQKEEQEVDAKVERGAEEAKAVRGSDCPKS